MIKVKFTKLTASQRDQAIIKLAYNYLTIKDCQKCGYPIVDGYVCAHCGDFNPSQS